MVEGEDKLFCWGLAVETELIIARRRKENREGRR